MSDEVEKIFNILVSRTEAIVEPDGIGNDIWRKSVASIGIQLPILSILATSQGDICQSTMFG
jgi:hypothetical protein